MSSAGPSDEHRVFINTRAAGHEDFADCVLGVGDAIADQAADDPASRLNGVKVGACEATAELNTPASASPRGRRDQHSPATRA